MVKRKDSEDQGGQSSCGKRGKISIADSVDVNAVMATEGPIVTIVMLRAGGECEEVILDMSPKLQLVAKQLGGRISFLGQWESLEVVLVIRGDQTDENVQINLHELQPPFHNATVRGDILLMRNDEDGTPVNFTIEEYKDFQKLHIEKWEPPDFSDDDDDEAEKKEDEEKKNEDNEDDEADDDDEDEDGEDNEDGEDEDDDDQDDDDQQTLFESMLDDELAEFRTANSREPTEEEMIEITEKVEKEVEEESAREDELLLTQVYDRVFQKFEADNSRPPDEAEVVTLKAQAAQYAEEIKARLQAKENGEEEDGEDNSGSEGGEEQGEEDGDEDEGSGEDEDEEDGDEEGDEEGEEEEGEDPAEGVAESIEAAAT